MTFASRTQTREVPLLLHRRSRWTSSAVTFGPVGRLVASVLLLVPLAWMVLYDGFFAIVSVPIWLFVILPWGLRDIWRAVRLPASEADEIRARIAADGASRPETDGSDDIARRASPRRW